MTVEPIRKILPYTAVAVVLAALYVAYTFYSRHDTEKRVERAADAQEAQADRASLDKVGGGKLNIVYFYATPAVVARGGAAKLCYGVAFAKTVRIEPETEAVWPSLGRCIDVKAVKTTQYTLTATDAKGEHVSKSVHLAVR